MNESLRAVALDDIAIVRAQGRDAQSFLDGQFTQSLADIGDGDTRFGAFCTPKGRAHALAYVISTEDGLLLAMDREVASDCVATLSRYVMRAQVRLTLADDLFARGAPADVGAGVPGAIGPWRVAETGAGSLAIFAGAKRLAPDAESTAAWQRRLVRAGLPALSASTAEQFVPQMINLDLLDGISFAKGCYTGQEIVARTQNLGRIKRRMLLFETSAANAPAGQAVVNASGTGVGRVVRSAGDELLAVLRLSELGEALRLGDADGAPLRQLPLPYAIPEIDDAA